VDECGTIAVGGGYGAQAHTDDLSALLIGYQAIRTIYRILILVPRQAAVEDNTELMITHWTGHMFVTKLQVEVQ
jgi:hypothetical protein